ncbi:hypothetical protein [Bacillus atrophaeus]|uniref:hypothetical protein n=1 Tax=Bacillus atrophaeus TaxID=1452 RepID=UPI002E1B7B19|nr:hypothetical protein [Bacillus atrophaeus]
MTEAFTLNAEQHKKQLDTYTDNLEVPYIVEQPIKIKYGEFNITVNANNEPSEHAIKRTNSKVNELMNDVHRRNQSLF